MHIDDDDLPIGRILSRREAVRLFAVGGAAFVAGCRPGSGGGAGSSTTGSTSTPVAAGGTGGTPASTSGSAALPRCVAKPELTVGPYFVDKQLNRADIRVEPSTGVASAGQPLSLSFRVQQIASGQCSPLPNAMVDVWQCDAEGRYSGVDDRMVGFNTVGKKFLRGYQVTDKDGFAHFATIYPGWYRGRAVHIHFKIRTPSAAALADQQDRTYEFTSQLFFDDEVTDQIHKEQPYAAKGQRDLRNANDGIYRQGGASLLVPVALSQLGYSAMLDVGLDLSDAATGRPERSGGPGGRGGPPPRRSPAG